MKKIDTSAGKLPQREKGSLVPQEFKSIDEERRHNLEIITIYKDIKITDRIILNKSL